MTPKRKKVGKNVDVEEDVDIEEVNGWLEAYKPTAKDLARQMQDNELVELCHRVKCRVDVWRWNIVDDHAVKFRSQGRLQQKTPRQALALLSKAVNRHKATTFYTAAEIDEQRKSEWRQRKKDNILRLDLWAYDRQQEAAKNASKEQNKVTPQNDVFNDSIINSEDLLEDGGAALNVSSASSSFSSLQNTTIISGLNNTSSRLLRSSTFSSTQSPTVDKVLINNNNNTIEIMVGKAPIASQNTEVISVHGSESPVAARHTPLKPTQSTQSTQLTQPSQKSAANMTADFMGLNSESLAFESENIEQLHVYAEVEIPYSASTDYADFNERISCTSTQSQGIK